VHNAEGIRTVKSVMDLPGFNHMQYQLEPAIVETGKTFFSMTFEVIKIVFDNPEDDTYFNIMMTDEISDTFDMCFKSMNPIITE